MTRIIQEIFADQIYGLSYARNAIKRSLPFSEYVRNVIVNQNEELEKRNGFGLFSFYGNLRGLHTVLDSDPGGATTEETYVWANDPDDSNLLKLFKLNKAGTLTLGYSGAGIARFSFLVSNSVWTASLTVDDVAVSGWPKTYGTGVESSPTAISQLESDIDGETDFTATLAGSNTNVPAASLRPVTNEVINVLEPIRYGSWTAIETAVSPSAYTQDYTTATFTNPNAATVNKVTYWARDQQGASSVTATGRQKVFKYDGLRCYAAGLPEFAATSTADGSAGSVFTAGDVHLYKTRFKRTDYKDNVVFSDLKQTTHTVGGSNVASIDLTGDTESSATIAEYMFRHAIVNGAQTNTTITVDSGHNITAGDEVWLLNSGTLTQLTVSSVTSTTVVFASSVTVTDNAIISNMTFEIYRTIAGGALFYFVAEVPADIENGTTYSDTTTDANLVLNDELVEPLILRTPPPPARFCCSHQGLIVLAGVPGREHEAFISDLTSAEYFPETNVIDVATSGKGPITGVGSDGERLYIFKGKAYVVISGNLRVVNPGQPPDIFVDERQAGIGCPAHGTIQAGVGDEGTEILYFLSYRGPQRLVNGQLDVAFAGRLSPYFNIFNRQQGEIIDYPDNGAFGGSGYLIYKNCEGAYDPDRKLYFCAISREAGTVDQSLYNVRAQVFVYQELQENGIGDRWYEWTDAAVQSFSPLGGTAGMCITGGRLMTAGRQRYSGSSSHGYVAEEIFGDEVHRLADNIQPIYAIYQLPWFHFNNPSVEKLLSSLRLWKLNHFLSTEDQSGTYTIRAYKDFISSRTLSNAFTSFTLDFTDDDTIEALNDFSLEGFKSILVEISNLTIYEGLRISGVELGFRAEFEGGELEDI